MNNSNLVVMIGNQLRHQYFANQLKFYFPLSAVFVEDFEHPKISFKSNKEKKDWNQFFIDRRQEEKKFLSLSDSLPFKNTPKLFNIEKGCLNNDATLRAIKNLKPTKIIIFGTSLLSTKYLKLYPNRILNLHVGLSQYYRGSSCNFWPIYEEKPNLLGATIHYVENGIDNGKIINQEKIKLEENDSEYTLMVKTVILGTKLMIDSINKTNTNLSPEKKPSEIGKLYLMKSFTPQAILKVRYLVTSGELKQKIATENHNRMKLKI